MATLKTNYLAIILAVTASCSMSAFSSCVFVFQPRKKHFQSLHLSQFSTSCRIYAPKRD